MQCKCILKKVIELQTSKVEYGHYNANETNSVNKNQVMRNSLTFAPQ
jgi:hypothetical protein